MTDFLLPAIKETGKIILKELRETVVSTGRFLSTSKPAGRPNETNENLLTTMAVEYEDDISEHEDIQDVYDLPVCGSIKVFHINH